MERKVRCIIKRTDEEFGHVTAISGSLKNLQSHVGGPIEMVYIRNRVAIICNEEGKLRGLPFNFHVTFRGGTRDDIVGDVIIIGTAGEELDDVPLTFDDWKTLLIEWGN